MANRLTFLFMALSLHFLPLTLQVHFQTAHALSPGQLSPGIHPHLQVLAEDLPLVTCLLEANPGVPAGMQVGFIGKGRRRGVDVEVWFHFSQLLSYFLFFSSLSQSMFYFYSMVYFLVPMYHLISHHRYKFSFFLLVLSSAASLSIQGLGLKGGHCHDPGHMTRSCGPLTCIYTYVAGRTTVQTANFQHLFCL